MKDKIAQRLQTLKTEYETGQKMLADLEAQQANLRETLLRISGAIQVLEEILDPAPIDSEPIDSEPIDFQPIEPTNGDRAIDSIVETPQ